MRTSILAFLAALTLTACTDSFSAAEGSFAGYEVTGAVHVPLTARGKDGKQYRFRNATFELTGAAMFTLADRDAREKDADRLITTLPAGGYSLYLRPGWELVELGSDGSVVPTHASLASENPVAFEIGRTLDARVTLTVRVGEENLVFGGSSPMKVTSLEVGGPSAL